MSVAFVPWRVWVLRGSELVETAPRPEALEPPESTLDPRINLPVWGVAHLFLVPLVVFIFADTGRLLSLRPSAMHLSFARPSISERTTALHAWARNTGLVLSEQEVRTALNGFHVCSPRQQPDGKGVAAFGCSCSGLCESGDAFFFINTAAPSRQLPGVQCAGFSVPWSQVSRPC